MPIILAVETSCDETAVAIIKNGKLLSNVVSSQVDVHKKSGGVIPDVAARLHVENIISILQQALKEAKIHLKDIKAIAVTRGPGLITALHIGVQAAKTLSLILNKPLIPVHHLAAHIYACEFVKKFRFPLIALIISGGSTAIILMKKHLDFKIIGETRDDAVGECFDKIARFLGFDYPGGAKIDELAKKGKYKYELPTPLLKDRYNFSFSGLKTAVINLVKKEEQKKEKINYNNLCFSFEKVAIDTIIQKTFNAVFDYKAKQVLIAGGVSANSYLRENMLLMAKNNNIDIIIPPIWCTTDNAAMVAKIAERLYKKKMFASFFLDADPNWKINDFCNFE
ncbi:MAG: tRNA (adenosine(37)-N6)-threonylcarbamoyltransferase complex transferase subunit TsaD [Bacilli bacterium]|nr:tRNA (adenosine(37)-N6)-threonylcarbamoyltransferase complex transferase subunit TsaD [Bacilli bacterium]